MSNLAAAAATVRGEPAWSPVQSLPLAKLTPSGLLQLDEDEVEVCQKKCVELRSDGDEPFPNPGLGGEWTNRNSDLIMTLTTHRLVMQSSSTTTEGGGTWFLHHSNVHQVTLGESFNRMLHWNTSPKACISSYALGNLLLCFKSTKSNASKDRDDLVQRYQQALERKAWETSTNNNSNNNNHNNGRKKTSDVIASRKVGVDAILTKNALRHEEAKQLTDTAFDGDADTLLREAAELVKVIRKYTSTLEHSGENNNNGEAQLSDMLSNMGMTSATSREDLSKSDFHQLLARQLADFLVPKLRQGGCGVMTLVDVYCLFNRARGTNLISPEDLLAAASLLGKLNLQLSMRSFEGSGVKVLQLTSFNDDQMATRLVKMATSKHKKGLTSRMVSQELQIPTLLAQEQLMAAERLGKLCRDVTLETTLFFPNYFVTKYI